MKIRKAVITAAGWGLRFLPATKAQPKEMLPLLDKPLIQYAVEEAIASGIENIIIVTAAGKRAIEDHFDRCFELEYFLEQKGNQRLLQEIRRLSNMVNICYIRQKQQLGLGHAVLMAKDIVGDEAFALLLPDEVFRAEMPALKQMIEIYNLYKTNIVAVEQVPRKDISKYGVIQSTPLSSFIHKIHDLVEKPEPEKAPSDLAIVGRYILTPQIFATLEVTPPGKNQEIQLTDALKLLLFQQEIIACQLEGKRYDAGEPLGLLKAAVSLALERPDTGEELRDYLRQLLSC